MASSPLTVVVVEDHTDSLEMLCEMLELGGLSAQGFSSPTAAWEQIERRAPDVVMTDLRIGEMSGLELARRVRSVPALDRVALVLLSGDLPELQRQEKSGLFDLLIAKPLDLGSLPRQLEALREQRASRG